MVLDLGKTNTLMLPDCSMFPLIFIALIQRRSYLESSSPKIVAWEWEKKKDLKWSQQSLCILAWKSITNNILGNSFCLELYIFLWTCILTYKYNYYYYCTTPFDVFSFSFFPIWEKIMSSPTCTELDISYQLLFTVNHYLIVSFRYITITTNFCFYFYCHHSLIPLSNHSLMSSLR